MRPVVLFDLDGTLVDTVYLHTYAWWRALDAAGELRPMASIHPLIGMGSTELLCTLVGRDDQEISEAHGHYFSELHPQVRSLPGAGDLVRAVVGAGGRAVVVTSAKEGDLPTLLGALGCHDEIEDVVHGEDTERAKPAPDLFDVALRRTGAGPGDAIAVGDAVWDVEAAAKVGLGCVALTTGGMPASRLEEAGAVAVYDSCPDLLERWGKSPLAALLAR